MISASTAASCSTPAALMAPLVAQKMKAGVEIDPCGVRSRPARARLDGSRAVMSNPKPG